MGNALPKSLRRALCKKQRGDLPPPNAEAATATLGSEAAANIAPATSKLAHEAPSGATFGDTVVKAPEQAPEQAPEKDQPEQQVLEKKLDSEANAQEKAVGDEPSCAYAEFVSMDSTGATASAAEPANKVLEDSASLLAEQVTPQMDVPEVQVSAQGHLWRVLIFGLSPETEIGFRSVLVAAHETIAGDVRKAATEAELQEVLVEEWLLKGSCKTDGTIFVFLGTGASRGLLRKLCDAIPSGVRLTVFANKLTGSSEDGEEAMQHEYVGRDSKLQESAESELGKGQEVTGGGQVIVAVVGGGYTAERILEVLRENAEATFDELPEIFARTEASLTLYSRLPLTGGEKLLR